MIINNTSQATYAGGLVTIFSGISLNELMAVAGLVLTIAAFVTNFIFLHREDRRDAARLARDREAWAARDADRDGGARDADRNAGADGNADGRDA